MHWLTLYYGTLNTAEPGAYMLIVHRHTLLDAVAALSVGSRPGAACTPRVMPP